MTLEKPKSKRSFGYMLRDRVRWVMSIPGLPGHVWQLLVVLSVRADEEGTVYEAITRPEQQHRHATQQGQSRPARR